MLNFSTASEYYYKYTNGKLIVSINTDLDKKEEIKEIIGSLDLVD